MTKIKAEEREKIVEKKGMISKFKDKHKYQIKKMEVMKGKYDIEHEVILNQNALTKALVYYATVQKTIGSVEVMGWLAGTKENGKIDIVNAYIGNCESSSAYTELDPTETIKMRDKAQSEGLVLVGQWHCHPGFSTSPSGIDDDFMSNIEKFGMKDSVQLIVNSKDFNLSIWSNGKRRKVDFIIPPKVDTKIGLNLGYIVGEYTPKISDVMFGDGVNMTDNWCVGDFYAYVGNYAFLFVGWWFPFLCLERWVEW